MGQACGTQLPEPGQGFASTDPARGTAPRRPAQPKATLHGRTRDAAIAATEPQFPVRPGSFAVLRSHGGSKKSAARVGESWKDRYSLGKELGSGVSANVYQAEALGSSAQDWASAGGLLALPVALCSARHTPRGAQAAIEKPRQVAVKRFKRVHTKSFATEVAALLQVGVHPNVVRLLESYGGCNGEDVLIFEYCEGLTVYDIFTKLRKNGEFLTEVLVAKLVRQALLALEHINACGVEHQDVKPENMLLYNVALDEPSAELKLADFGWAVRRREGSDGAGDLIPELPKDGAGSLWYAPPELNPPLPGTRPPAPPAPSSGMQVLGRADMWSMGVVLYLLLVGQNPFHKAAKGADQKAVAAEVIRLVSIGQFDNECNRWKNLPVDARGFITSTMQVQRTARSLPGEALRHPFLVRRLARCAEVAPVNATLRWSDRDDAWEGLDGFQRLGWGAVARAVAEPELQKEIVVSAARAARSVGSASRGRSTRAASEAYLWQLAKELCSLPLGHWLKNKGVWPEIVRLAFRYLDADGDGLLNATDITSHFTAEDSSTAPMAEQWIKRWGGHLNGLLQEELLAALMDQCIGLDVSECGDLVSDGEDEDEASFRPRGVRCGTGALVVEDICSWHEVKGPIPQLKQPHKDGVFASKA